MNRKSWLVAGLIYLSVSATASGANFVVTSAGPHDSAGFWNDAGNAVLFPKYAGPLYPADKIEITGTVTQVHPSSLASDSSWWLKASTGTGTAFSFIPQMTKIGNYTTETLTHYTYGLFWIGNYPQYRFEAVENGGTDEPGVDAQWTNMKFEFHSAVPVISTGWNTGTGVSIDTGGSNFNTQLALYKADGTLVAQDDDGGPTPLSSRLDFTSLNVGEYLLVAGGFGSTFQDLSGLPGADFGDLTIRVNGTSLFDGALESERFQIINVTVVPEPASVVLFALGGLAVFGMRRKLMRWAR